MVRASYLERRYLLAMRSGESVKLVVPAMEVEGGVSPTTIMVTRLLQRRGWLEAVEIPDQPLQAADVHVRLTDRGARAAARTAHREGTAVPSSVDEAVGALRLVAPPWSELGHGVDSIYNDLLARGVHRSGIVQDLMRLADAHGYRWSAERRAFVVPWTRRLRVPAAIVGGAAAVGLALVGSLASSKAALAVTAAATAAAAFASLLAVLFRDR